MKTQDKKDIRQIFNEGLEQLVLPILDDIYKNMATKKDLDAVKEDVAGLREDVAGLREDVAGLREDVSVLTDDVASIDRKLDAEIAWRDDASKRLKKVEVKLGFVK